MLLSEEPHAMDVLSPIHHILCVHGQGPTSLEAQSIYRDAVHPSHRAVVKLWEQIWRELQINHTILRLVYIVTWKIKAMNVLSLIPHVLWMHAQGLTSLVHDKYTMTLFQLSEYP